MKKNSIWIIVLIFGLTGVLLFCFWQTKSAAIKPIPAEESDDILTITRVEKSDGTISKQSITGDELDEKTSRDLLDCLARHTMKSNPVSGPSVMTMTDPYLYLSIWLQKKDETRYTIQLSTTEAYSVVEYGKENFPVTESGILLEEVEQILSEAFRSAPLVSD